MEIKFKLKKVIQRKLLTMRTVDRNVAVNNSHEACLRCGGRLSSDLNIHPSMLKCEQCGYLVLNPNYVPFLGCH